MHPEYWIPKVTRVIVSTSWDPYRHGVNTTVPPQQRPVKTVAKTVPEEDECEDFSNGTKAYVALHYFTLHEAALGQ
jgi:hypothetical protein